MLLVSLGDSRHPLVDFGRPYEQAAEIYYQNSCQPPFSDMHLVVEVFQGRESKEMLTISNLVSQACI